MNVGEAKRKVIKIIREYSNQGTVISDDENSDYLLSMNEYLDMAQKEIATTNSLIIKEFNIAHYPSENILGNTYSIKVHRDEDAVYQSNDAKAYYFEVNGYATVYIEEFANNNWGVIETLTNSGSNSFTAYKGLIESDNKIRLRFSGDYVYQYKNYALYRDKFPVIDMIPNFNTYVEYQLPDDYYKIDRVVSEHDYGVYATDSYRLEKKDGKTYILFDRNEIGEYKVFYCAYPETIPFDYDNPKMYDHMEFDISEEAQQVMLYWVAYLSKLDTDPYLADQYLQQYYIKVNSLKNVNSTGFSKIINKTGW